MVFSNSRHLSSIKQERELTKLCFSKSQSNATWYAEPLHQRNRNVYLIYSKWKPNQGASCRAQEWNGYNHISSFKVSIYFHFFPKGFPQWCGNVPVSQEYSRSFRRQAATNNRWVWDKEAQCVGLDREALGFFSPYQMCFRHSFVYSCFWVGKRRHLLNLLIRLKYFKSLYTLHTTHRILGAPNFYYNSNLVLVNPTGSWHCQFLPVLKGWKILINSHVPGSDNTEICVKFS